VVTGSEEIGPLIRLYHMSVVTHWQLYRHYVGDGLIYASCFRVVPVRPSVCRWCDISVLSGGISMKLDTNIHHASGCYCRGF